MSNKLVSRLLSFTLSATVALTSGVPALAYDGGGGEDLLEVEDEEIQLLEEEEVGSDFDVEEEEEEEEFLEDIEVEEDAVLEEDETEFEEDADFLAADKLLRVTPGNGTNVHYTYATGTTADFTFTAEASETTGAPSYTAYTNVTWNIYKVAEVYIATDVIPEDSDYYDSSAPTAKYQDIGTTTSSGADEAAADTIADWNLEESELEDYGIATSVNGAVLSIGCDHPNRALASSKYVIKMTDNGNKDNAPVKTLIDVAVADFTISNDMPTIDPDGTPGNADDYRAIIFAPADMGYSVVDASATEFPTTPYTQAKELKLTVSGLDEGYAIKGFEYEFDGPDASAFIVEDGYEDGSTVDKGLYTKNPRTLTIKPKTGLTNKGNKGGAHPDGTTTVTAGDGVYLATLKISSYGRSTPIEIPVVFEVGNNLTITGAQAHGGEEADLIWVAAPTVPGVGDDLRGLDYYTYDGADYNIATTGAAATDYYVNAYDLGNVSVGDPFDDMYIYAAGGSGDIIFVEPVSTSDYLVAGVQGRGTVRPGSTMYQFYGTATAKGTKLFRMHVKDSEASPNLSDKVYFTYSIVDYELEVKVEDTAVKYGGANGVDATEYSWFGPKNYSADEEVKNIYVTNKSKVDTISVTAAGDANFIVEAPLTVSIEPGKTAAFAVTPKTGITGTTPVTGTVQLTGTNITTTDIDFRFTLNGEDYAITTPVGSTITDAYVGQNYSYKFGVTKSSNVKTITWAVKSVTPTAANLGNGVGTVVNDSDTAKLSKAMEKLGLSLDPISGVLSGVPKILDTYTIVVTATGKDNNGDTVDADSVTGGTQIASKTATLDVQGTADNFKFTANGAEVNATTNKLDLGTISIGDLDTFAAEFTVSNVSLLDIEKANVRITAETKGTTSPSPNTTGTPWFDLVFDEENAILDTDLATAFEIRKGDSRTIKLVVNSLAEQYTDIGTYTITISANDTDNPAASPKSFVATLKIVDAPIVGIGSVSDFKVGTEITTTKAYAVSVGGITKTSEYNFEWIKGSVAGLTLDKESGKVTGTPTKAGDYDVVVKATKKTDSSVYGTLEHTITVAGASTLTLAAGAYVDGDVILLPGMIQGEDAETKLTININSGTKDAENVTLKVEDASDNRTVTQIWNVKANPENPYAGSSNYIDVDKTSFNKIKTDGNENFSIVTKGSPAPGVYKVKITISGDNTNTIVIYALMAVVEKLVIAQPNNVTTSIGTNHTTTPIELAISGGMEKQTVKWSEVGKKVTKNNVEKTEYYVTKAGATNVAASDITGLNLQHEASAIGAAENAGLKNEIKGSMNKAGTYDVTLKAEVPATTYTAPIATTYDTVTEEEPQMSYDQIIGLSNAKIKNPALANTYPKQTAENVSFRIVSGKSTKVSVVGATGPDGEVVGLKNGTVQVTFDGFTYAPVITGYSNASQQLTVTVKNASSVAMDATAALSADSKFEINETNKTKNIAAGGTTTFVVRPKTSLAKGTYTDTLKISSDDFETVEFNLSFTVADNTYYVSAYETADNDVVYMTDNVSNGKAVELDNYFATSTPVSTKGLTIKNTGNTIINNLSVYEVKQDGSKYDSGSSDTMLKPMTIGTSLSKGATDTITVAASKKVAGVYSTYLNIHFTEGTGLTAVPHDFKIPVTYTVYDKDIDTITVTPANDIEITAAEGYAPADEAVTVSIKNAGTGTTSVITGYSVSLNNGTNFKIATEAEDTDISAGNAITWTLVPVKGLAAGEYTDRITISGGNIKTAITRNVKFTVAESTTYTALTDTLGDAFAKVGTAGTRNSYAERLYNTLVGLSKRTENKSPRVEFATTIATGAVADTVYIDFDNSVASNTALTSSNADVQVAFTGTSAVASTELSRNLLATVETATFTTLATNSVETAEKAVVVSDEAVKFAKKAIGYNGGVTPVVNAKYFTIVNFEFYQKVVFGVTAGGATTGLVGTVYAEKKTEIDNLPFVEAETAITATKNKDHAVGLITVYVPFGATLGSAFTSGKLPTAIKDGQVMTTWKTSSGAISANKVIMADYPSVTPDMHKHEYALSNVTDEKYVKWVWTKDEKGNLSAVLHLFCVEDGCPDYEGSEVIIDGTDKTSAYGSLTYGGRDETEATCEKAAGYTYTVSATTVANTIAVASRTYVGKYVEENSGEPLGHNFDITNPATIVWTDANSDKKITADEIKVTRTCTRDATHVLELKVVSVDRDAEASKLPTCLQPGYDVFSITYTEIDEKGNPASNVTVPYNKGEKFVVPATGHSEEVDVIVTDFDKETKKGMVTIKCKNENCDATDHILFGPAEVTFRDAGSETYAAEVTLSDGTKRTITYVNDVFYNATVNWTKKFDSKYTKGTGLPEIQYTITYTSKNTGKSVTTEAFTATVTADKDYSATSTEKEITFTATADLTGYYKDKEATTAATASPLTETYKFKNGGLEGTTGQEIGGDMMVEGLEDEYYYTGAPIKPAMVVTDGDMVLAQGVDYTVKYKNNTKISSKSGDEYTKTAEVTVTGKGNYAGQGQTLYFAIIDPKDEVKDDDADLTGASMKLPKETLIYTGEAVYPSAIELKLKGGSYVTYKHQGDGVYANDDSDIPAVVTFANNINKGSATVMLTGKPNAKGVTKTLKKNFTIKALALNTTDFTVNVAETAVWAVKGAQPEVTVTWNGSDLVLGQDFTVSYDKSNKKVGPSKVTVKGKGNFTKKLEQSFTVTALPLAEEMVAAVSAFVGKKGAKVTLLDGAGNVIPTSLYTVSVFDGETDVTKAKLEADKDYTIKIAKKAGKTELGDDALEITAQAGINLSSVKINAKSVEKTFTGEAITLTDDDIAKITVTYKGTTLVYGTDYEITGYANNIKKGKMTVTIAGMGKYAGFKTFKVKIAPKPIAATN